MSEKYPRRRLQEFQTGITLAIFGSTLATLVADVLSGSTSSEGQPFTKEVEQQARSQL